MPSGHYVRTKEYRDKMREVALAKGYGLWMVGRPGDPERIRKMAAATTGPKHWKWKGGVSYDPSYKAHLNGQRRVMKLAAPGTHNLPEWNALKELVNHRCVRCGKQEPDITLTKDHILPLSKSGSDDITNIQPLCKSCNSQKSVGSENYLHDI